MAHGPRWEWCIRRESLGRDLPFSLELLKDFPLRVVAQNAHIDKAIDVELLGSEMRHDVDDLARIEYLQ